MTDTQPLVSIVIPAFNAEATLADTVRSALASTYSSIEIIIVDDGSTDGTAAIARSFAEQDQRVRVLGRENGGLSAALNTGFADALGDYVARLDADDLWHPTKLERQMAVAAANPDAAFVYSFVRYIDADARVLHDGPRQEFPPRALARGIYETIVGGGSSALMKRSAIEEAGGCDESFRSLEDLLLQLKISARHDAAFVPEYLVGYRVRAGSLTRDLDTMRATWDRLLETVRSLFPQVPSYLFDWADAARSVGLAEDYAWAGRPLRSAELLMRALRDDPAYVLRFLGYRSTRSVLRRFSGRRRRGPAPFFFDLDPAKPASVDRFDIPPEGAAMIALRKRRAKDVAILDQKLRPGSAGRHGRDRR